MEKESHLPEANIYTDPNESIVGADFVDRDGQVKKYKAVYRIDNPSGPNGIAAALSKVVRFLENLGGEK